jgi:hypothetical protein
MLSKVGTQKSKNYGQYLVIFCRIKKWLKDTEETYEKEGLFFQKINRYSKQSKKILNGLRTSIEIHLPIFSDDTLRLCDCGGYLIHLQGKNKNLLRSRSLVFFLSSFFFFQLCSLLANSCRQGLEFFSSFPRSFTKTRNVKIFQKVL